LLALRNFNDFRIGNAIGLYLEFNAKNAEGEIIFPSDFALRIFINQNNQWVEISQLPMIYPPENVILSVASPVNVVSFFPDLPDKTKKYEMRAYVFGDMKTKNGSHQVSAFVDFKLTP
jgi:hypothetical protein